MNRALYTILIAAISVGITLAFVSGCSKKCVCDNSEVSMDSQNDDTSNDELYNNAENNDGNATSYGKQSSRKPLKKEAANPVNNRKPAGEAPEQKLTKYGDQFTGGNVYTDGGYTPGRVQGTKPPKKDTIKPVKGGGTSGIKTGNYGQRN